MPKCACGCGEDAKEGRRFISGHNSRTPEGREFSRKIATEWSHSPEGKAHIHQWNNSPEGRANLEKIHEEWSRSPEGRASSKKIATVWINSPEFKDYIERRMASPEGKAQFEKMLKGWIGSPKFKKHLSKNIKTGQAALKKWRSSPEGKLQHEILLEQLHNWVRSPEGKAKMRINISKAQKAVRPKISGLEQRAFTVFLNYGLPFEFVGDLRVESIGGKYPDFIDKDSKIIVEVCNKKEKEFRHKKPWEQYEKERIRHYARFGYKCLVLWDNLDDEEMVWRAGSAVKDQNNTNVNMKRL